MSSSELKIARDFALPLDLVTEATAIVATRGAGKSSTSTVIAEEGFAAGVQTVVFDRTGVYWGLRSNAKGDGPGLGIYVLGGPHGDVPLEPTAGILIADLVVDSGHSFVLDLSDFSKGNAVKFAAAFLERLYDRKARSRTTTLLVMDEAHFYAPQTPRGGFKGDGATLMGAMEDVVGLGRSRGIGVVLTTQRTQALNKAVLDLIETLLVMRMLSPRARDAVQDWIREKHEDDREGVIATLESLPTGTAWVWSPLRGILKKVAVRRIRTFDSYATPKPGETRVEPSARKQLDLGALGEQMRSTAERAKENDPAELRKRIRELEHAKPTVDEAEVTRLREALRNAEDVATQLDRELYEANEKLAEIERHERAHKTLCALLDELHDLQERGLAAMLALDPNGDGALPPPTRPRLEALHAARPTTEPRPVRAAVPRPEPTPRPAREAPRPVPASSNGSAGGDVTGPQQKILNALAWWSSIGVDRPTRLQVAFVAGYSHSQSRGFRDPLYALNAGELVHYPEPKTLALTDAGQRLAVPPAYDPTERELQEMVYGLIGTNRAKMLLALVQRYPHPVSREELALELGYSHAQSRGFRDPLYKLHALELVAYPSSGMVAAEPVMFLEAVRA